MNIESEIRIADDEPRTIAEPPNTPEWIAKNKKWALQSIIDKCRPDSYASREYRPEIKGVGYIRLPNKKRTQPIDLSNEAEAARVIAAHLSPAGPHVAVEPMPIGKMTRLAAIDFDDHEDPKNPGGRVGWASMKKAALAVSAALRSRGMDTMPVKSGGGDGIHLWMWWSEWVPAASVRRLVKDALAEEGYTEGAEGVAKKQVEIFPNGDEVTKDHFGNNIALPFGRASVPLGRDMEPTDLPIWPADGRNPELQGDHDDEPEETGATGRRQKGSIKPGTADDLENIKEALSHCNADDNGEHNTIGYALHNLFHPHLSDEANAVYCDWSRNANPEKHGPKERNTEKRWSGFKVRQSGPRAGLNYIYTLAEKHSKAAGGSYKRPQKSAVEASYVVIGGALSIMRYVRGLGMVPTAMCNFDARIEESIRTDNGNDVSQGFKISGATSDGVPLPPATIQADRALSPWWISEWRGLASVKPDFAGRLFHALQEVSNPIPQRTVYSHLGWRLIDGQWLYLHAGGAIGVDGPVDDIQCAPGGALNSFILPPVTDIKAAVRASLGLFDLGPIGALGYALVHRAPLCQFNPADFSPWFAGRTGSWKSSLGGLLQSFWGPTWNYKNLPAGWSSTANSLEKMAYLAKDALLFIDDSAPQKSESGRKGMDDKHERVLRAQGNLQGRGRMNADSTLKDAYPPRGIIAGTGEDVPAGGSIRARLVIVQMKKGDLDPGKVLPLDREAAKTGILAQSMAGYVRYLAGRVGTLSAELAKREAELLDSSMEAAGEHSRTPASLASLLLGLEQGLAYAVAVGAITPGVASELRKTGEASLRGIAGAQHREIDAEDEVTRFLNSVRAALNSGAAHVITRSGDEMWPAPYETVTGWQDGGWKQGFYNKAEDKTSDPTKIWTPRGTRIGWIDIGSDRLMLDPEQALVAVQQQQRAIGKTISLDVISLGKRLKEADKLTETNPDRHTKQVKIRGALPRVWMLSASATLGLDMKEAENGGMDQTEVASLDGPPDQRSDDVPF